MKKKKELNLLRKGNIGLRVIVLVYNPISPFARIRTFVEDQNPLPSNAAFGLGFLTGFLPVTGFSPPSRVFTFGFVIIWSTEEQPLLISRFDLRLG